MAVINYKEKYEKAVQAAMLAKEDTESAVTIGILEEIFPELAESDDERIRKALINGFNKLDKNAVWYNGITNGQILAWLEKQGNNMGISEATKKKLENALNKALEKETPESFNKFLDEQGEQKSAHIDYVSGIRKELLNIEDNAENINGLTESQWVAIRAAHRLLGECMDKEQKPAAWSEDDEKLYNDAISLAYEVDDEELKCWFIGIKERVKPKPEWSKNDSSMALTLMRDIEQVSFISKEGKEERIKWLNRLCDTIRPQSQWKPSDEQMEALDDFIYAKYPNIEKYGAAVKSLYQDLKKLREE